MNCSAGTEATSTWVAGEEELGQQGAASVHKTHAMPPFYQRFVDDYGERRGRELFEARRKWRERELIGQILYRPFKEFMAIQELVPGFTYGIAKCGAPVLYDKIGALRPRELVKQGYHVEHVMTLMLWRLEYYLLSQNHRDVPYVNVIDLNGLTFANVTSFFTIQRVIVYRGADSSFLCHLVLCVNRLRACCGTSASGWRDLDKQLCKAYSESIEKMYHGLVAHMLVINSPSAVKAMYRIVRPILPAYIQERIHFLSDVTELQHWIDASELHTDYGGTNMTPPYECAFMKDFYAHWQKVNIGQAS